MQKGRPIRRRHTRTHLKVWEYFHKKPHIQLPAHSFYENNEWFLYFSLILCRFYPRGGELRLLLRSIFDFLSGSAGVSEELCSSRRPRTSHDHTSTKPGAGASPGHGTGPLDVRSSSISSVSQTSSNNATILSMEHFVKTILTKIRDSRRNRSVAVRNERNRIFFFSTLLLIYDGCAQHRCRHNGAKTMGFESCLLSRWSCFEVKCVQEWRRRLMSGSQW